MESNATNLQQKPDFSLKVRRNSSLPMHTLRPNLPELSQFITTTVLYMNSANFPQWIGYQEAQRVPQ